MIKFLHKAILGTSIALLQFALPIGNSFAQPGQEGFHLLRNQTGEPVDDLHLVFLEPVFEAELVLEDFQPIVANDPTTNPRNSWDFGGGTETDTMFTLPNGGYLNASAFANNGGSFRDVSIDLNQSYWTFGGMRVGAVTVIQGPCPAYIDPPGFGNSPRLSPSNNACCDDACPKTPEPTSTLSLLAFGTLGAASALKNRQNK